MYLPGKAQEFTVPNLLKHSVPQMTIATHATSPIKAITTITTTMKKCTQHNEACKRYASAIIPIDYDGTF